MKTCFRQTRKGFLHLFEQKLIFEMTKFVFLKKHEENKVGMNEQKYLTLMYQQPLFFLFIFTLNSNHICSS